jgi:hypothetical protein
VRAIALVGITMTMALSALAGVANAYTGGPTYAHVLGYDPQTNCAYAAITHVADNGGPSALVRLDFRSTGGIRPIKVEFDPKYWERASRGILAADSVHQAKLDSIAAPLWRLERACPSVLPAQTIFRRDTLRVGRQAGERRTWVRITGLRSCWSGQVEVATVGSAVVAMSEFYRVPGETRAIAVVSFFGDPYGSEETQWPVILPTEDDPPLRLEGAPPH